MYLYMYVFIYVCMNICMCEYMYIRMFICGCMYICMRADIIVCFVLVKGTGDRHLPGSFINEVEEALVETAKEVCIIVVHVCMYGAVF